MPECCCPRALPNRRHARPCRLIPRFALLTLAGELWINSAPTGAGTLARPGVSTVKSKAETAWMSKKRMGANAFRMRTHPLF